MDITTKNTQVYQDFIENLMNERKIENRSSGIFRASIEIRPYGRYSSECNISYGYIHRSDNFQMSVHVDDLLDQNEKYKQGKFPSGFYTNETPPWPAMEFKQSGRALHITGVYFDKKFEAVINPL